MPELPEVSIIVSQLDKKLKGLVLQGIETDWPKKFFWAAGPTRPLARRGDKWVLDLKGVRIVGVRRLGKVVIIDLERKTGPAARHPHPTSTPALAAFISEKSIYTLAREELTREGLAAGARRGSPTRVTRFSILIHLKLTGQLIYQDKKTRVAGGHPIPPLNLPVPNKTTRVIFSFTSGPASPRLRGASHLYFNDVRKFGWVKIIENEESKIREAIGMELGPDPLTMSFEDFKSRLVKRGQMRIKKLLMDQAFVAGIGNIYSDEALWQARIHPKRSAASLSEGEIKELFDGIRDSLKLAIEKGGSSASAYVDSGGERGLYLSYARAYHMTGRPCARCQTPIVRQKMDGRSAHFCPSCQKLK